MKEVSDNIFFNVKEIETLSIPSKTVLLEEGKVADKIYLVRKGCLRLFFYNEGKDITFQFFFEGDFVASFDSLYRGTPSLFSLESIEPSEVVSIKKEDFYHKIESNPSLRLLYEELNSSYKCNGIHINNLFKFFVWCEVSKSFTRSII